jgi:50S ribosomal subunit-associated GTPase HflX
LDVLREIGAGDHPILTVYNKADLLDEKESAMVEALVSDGILVSAATGVGLDALISEIVNHVSPVRV